MIDIEIKGLSELIRNLEKLPDRVLQEPELELQKVAQTLCERARSICTDPLVRSQINYRVFRRENELVVEIFAPDEAKNCLKQAFEEIKPYIGGYVSLAIEKALNELA